MCQRSSATKCRPSIRRPLSDRRSVQRPWACCFTAGRSNRASGSPSPKILKRTTLYRAVHTLEHVRSKSRRSQAKQAPRNVVCSSLCVSSASSGVRRCIEMLFLCVLLFNTCQHTAQSPDTLLGAAGAARMGRLGLLVLSTLRAHSQGVTSFKAKHPYVRGSLVSLSSHMYHLVPTSTG